MGSAQQKENHLARVNKTEVRHDATESSLTLNMAVCCDGILRRRPPPVERPCQTCKRCDDIFPAAWSDETAKRAYGNTVASYERSSGRNPEWHGFGVFDKAVASWFDNVSEKYGLTEDGKTVAPLFADFCSKSIAFPSTQTSHLQVASSGLAHHVVELAIKGDNFDSIEVKPLVVAVAPALHRVSTSDAPPLPTAMLPRKDVASLQTGSYQREPKRTVTWLDWQFR